MDSGSIVVTVSGFYSQAMEVVSKHMISIGVIVSGLYVQLMEMIRSLYEDTSDKLSPIYTRVSSFVDEIVNGHCKIWPFQSLNGPFAIGSLISFVVAMSCAYLYLFPSSSPVVRSYGITPKPSSSIHKCNVFEGRWIRDESYPLYNASHCPFAERGFNCLANGRKYNDYSKWRWKPKNCEIPRFNVRAVLEKLQGKRVVFVGDSLSRTQWESFICLLMVGVEDKRSVYEVNGNEITKKIRFLGVLFSSFRLRVDFYRSIFLVQPTPAPSHSPKRVKSTLRLDLMDDISKEWIDSDVLIFNSGHWWTPSKLFEM